MDQLLNLLKRNAAQMDSTRAHPSWATVVAYNPADHTAKVTLQPEGETTNWLPVLEAYTGGGAAGTASGVVSPPVVGQQVFVCFEAGSRNDGVIVGGGYSRSNRPPVGALGAAVQPGEIALVAGPSNIHVQRGRITITCGTTLTINAPANLIINAPNVQTSGSVQVGTGASGSFSTPTGQTVVVKDGIVVLIS